MSKFLTWLSNKLFPTREPTYPDYILEAAEFEDCDPKEIMWCETCDDWHMSYYG